MTTKKQREILETYIYNYLKSSLEGLRSAVKQAKGKMNTTNHGDWISRFDQYEEIVEKQDSMYRRLDVAFQYEDWEEVERQIKLITALSEMLKDDAKDLLKKSAGN